MLNEDLYRNGTPEEVFSMVDALDSSLFAPLTRLARDRYAIPDDVFERHCRRVICVSRLRYFKVKKIFRRLTPLVFRFYYNLLKIFLLLFPRYNGESFRADVAFELWVSDGSPNYKFYENIHSLIQNKTTVAFVANNISKKVLKKVFKPSLIFSRFRIDRRIVREVLKKEKIFLPPNSSGIDSYFLWSAFLRQYSIHLTQSRNLKVKTYITAGDNYLSPLRYWLMKQSGIKNIISLQNGLRTNCLDSGGAYYNETDIYEVFGTRQQALLQRQGCRAQKWLPLGNIPTINKIKDLKFTNEGPIVVIGHDFSYTIGSYNQNDFNQILEYIRRFSIEHKKHIQYQARTGTQEERRNYEKHLASDWSVFDDSTDCYSAVASASVCINYLSTLGTEAIGMGKRVLTFNFYHDELLVDNEDGYGVVLGKDYNEFEQKLLVLLNDQSQKVLNYFDSLRRDRMLLNLNVFAMLAQHCE